MSKQKNDRCTLLYVYTGLEAALSISLLIEQMQGIDISGCLEKVYRYWQQAM